MKQLLGSYFKQLGSSLKPYIADRGYEREFQAENAPFETWKDRRYFTPPPPYSEAELRWGKDNRGSP